MDEGNTVGPKVGLGDKIDDVGAALGENVGATDGAILGASNVFSDGA